MICDHRACILLGSARIINTSYQKLPFGSGDYPEKLSTDTGCAGCRRIEKEALTTYVRGIEIDLFLCVGGIHLVLIWVEVDLVFECRAENDLFLVLASKCAWFCPGWTKLT